MNKVKILVPTDFSDYAHNALTYAIGLAEDLNAEIILLHSIIYHDFVFIDHNKLEEENTRKYNDARDRLDQELNFIKNSSPALKARTELDADNAEQAVVNLIEAEKINYVVMGTEGASGIKAELFGSFTNSILLISPCPVFTVPRSGKYKGLNYLICTTDMDETEKPAISETLRLAEERDATLVFYNVNEDEDKQRVKFSKFQKYIKSISSHPLIDYVVVESNDTLKSVEDYVCDIHPDLIITLGKERSFFHKLFGKKVTKRLCLHTNIPLLSFPVYHSEFKKQEKAEVRKA